MLPVEYLPKGRHGYDWSAERSDESFIGIYLADEGTLNVDIGMACSMTLHVPIEHAKTLRDAIVEIVGEMETGEEEDRCLRA